MKKKFIFNRLYHLLNRINFCQKPLRNFLHSKDLFGFTIVELLVVIAIITTLAAMLLPSLQAARKRAKSSICVNQLRQIGILLSMYASDWNSWLPPAFTSGSGCWSACLERGGYLATTTFAGGDPPAAPMGAKILRCPNDTHYYRYWSYSTTYGICYYPGEFADGVSFRYPDTSKLPTRWLIADSHDNNIMGESYLINAGCSTFGIRHLGRGSVLRWDLSVGSYTNEDAKTEGFYDGVNENYDYGT